MKKKTSILIILATSFILLGLIIFTLVMCAYNWDFSRLSTIKFQTKTYQLVDDFSNVEIDTITADIAILPSTDSDNKVICFEDEKQPHTVAVSNGKLTINVTENRKWYEHIGINFKAPKITVYLNKTVYQSLGVESNTGSVEIGKEFTFNNIDVSVSTGDVKCLASANELIKIKTSTGNIALNNLSANTINLTVSTGDVTLDGVNCKLLISDGDTGDITIKNVIATDKFEIERDTGDVIFYSSDAGEIYVETDTGDVKGSLLTKKNFIADSDTGRVNVPDTTSGGKCKIETNTGDIIITIV